MIEEIFKKIEADISAKKEMKDNAQVIYKQFSQLVEKKNISTITIFHHPMHGHSVVSCVSEKAVIDMIGVMEQAKFKLLTKYHSDKE